PRIDREQQGGDHRQRGGRRHARPRRGRDGGAAGGTRLRAGGERGRSGEPCREAERGRAHRQLQRDERARDPAPPARKVLVEIRDAAQVRVAQHAPRTPGGRGAPVVHGDRVRHVAQAEAGGAETCTEGGRVPSGLTSRAKTPPSAASASSAPSSAVSAPGASSQSLLSINIVRPAPAAAPALLARPKPTLSRLWIRRARGNFSATIA